MLSEAFTALYKQIILSHQSPFHVPTLCLLTCHRHSCSLYLATGVKNMIKLNLLTLRGIRIMTKPLFSIQISMVLPVTYLVEGWASIKDF